VHKQGGLEMSFLQNIFGGKKNHSKKALIEAFNEVKSKQSLMEQSGGDVSQFDLQEIALIHPPGIPFFTSIFDMPTSFVRMEGLSYFERKQMETAVTNNKVALVPQVALQIFCRYLTVPDYNCKVLEINI